MGKHKEEKRSKEGRKSSKSDKKRSKKEHKSKKRSHTSSSSGSEADYRLDAQTAPVAAEYVRCILRKFPGMKMELRDLMWQIDDGKCPEINKVDDPDLLRGLRGLFGALNLKRSRDTYSLKRGQDKILRRIGIVFSESIPDRSSDRLCLPGDPMLQQKSEFEGEKGCSPLPPREIISAPRSSGEECQSSPRTGAQLSQPDDTPATRKVMFPAAAPQELLQAAAEAAAAMRAEGLLGDIVAGLLAQSVGPAPPPDVLKELDTVSGDVRTAEAVRINGLVARGLDHGPDAYQVLDVPATATVPEVRKKFWRISLLVHPDKCRHEGAATAFDAVKKAAEILMDATSRNDLDERKRKQAEADLDQQVAAELEKDRLWRVAQGTATAEDLKGPLDMQDTRDEWMTALPQKKQSKPAYMSQASVTSFSQQGGVGNAESDAGWTALPGQKASEVRLLTSEAGAMARTVQPMTVKESIAAKNLQLMALAQQQEKSYQPEEPAKTLLEKHQESIKLDNANRKRQRKEARNKAESGVAEAKEKHPDWAGNSPWRPFDREKDLQVPGRSIGPGPTTDQSLACRFRPASS